jgi:hypothetical protein
MYQAREEGGLEAGTVQVADTVSPAWYSDRPACITGPRFGKSKDKHVDYFFKLIVDTSFIFLKFALQQGLITTVQQYSVVPVFKMLVNCKGLRNVQRVFLKRCFIYLIVSPLFLMMAPTPPPPQKKHCVF